MIELNGIEIYVYLFCNAVSIFIISLFMDIFFDRSDFKCKKYFRSLSYILYWGISSAGYLLFQWPSILMLLLTIAGTTVISLTYNGSWKYRICSVVTIIAVQIVCEETVWYLLVKLQAMQLFIIGLLAVQILTFMIAIFLRKMVDLKKGEDVLFGDWVSVVVIPVWSIIISVLVLDGCENELAVAVCGTSMILINVLVFYILNRMQSVYRKQLDIGILEQQNKAYEYQMMISRVNEERIDSIHHDMKNHFLVLDQLAEKGNNVEIQGYLKELRESVELDNEWILTGNQVIDGFINIKLNEAAKYDVNISTNVNVSKDLNINPRDISIVLGNLLDNALQALKGVSKEEKQKILKIEMRQEPGMLYIKIINSHNEKIKKRGEVFQTTKLSSKRHGIGLKNVKQIVDLYSGHMEIEHTDENFSVELVMFI